MIAAFFLLLISFAYSLAPTLAGWPEGPEMITAHIVGPLIIILAVMARFPSFAFLRHANTVVGFLLTLSPFLFFRGWPSALVIQAVVGLWVMAFSMLSSAPREGGGWRRTLNAPISEDKALEWS
ncbi:MAG: hypothetical protein EOP05_11780 [Proteobacteria bacterium]|nr:MAG: hypothetical protein EOP05_11780 [Pseudomonadota bacterium]